MPIACAGALGYLLADWHSSMESALPWQTGYVCWPAVLGMSVTAIATAPWGATLTHSLPVGLMRKSFALVLVVVGAHLLSG